MANNNVKNIQFLRNETVLGTRQDAINALETQKGNVADGSIILARYGSETNIKTLAGLVYVNGNTRTVTIIDVEGASGDVETLREEINAKLGTGVTSSNTATAQLQALSGSTADTSATTSVAGAKKYTDDKIVEAVNDLDYTDTAVTGNYVSAVNEADGKISVTREPLPTVEAISVAGKPITAVSESLGTIAASAGTINAEFVTVADAGSAFTATDVEGVLAEIDAAYKAADAAIIDNASESANTLAKLEDIVNDISADAKEYHIVKTTTGLPETTKEKYSLVDAAGNVSGDTIDIPKDSHIVSITYITDSGDTHYQNLEYKYIDASGATKTEYVDISSLVLEAEFASGVTAIDHVVRGVVDSASEKDSNNDSFLTVGTDGFKVDGIKDEIDAKIAALDATGGTQTIATDKHVAVEVIETDGKITTVTVVEDNIADADDLAALSAKTVTEIDSSNSSITVSTAATTAADGTVKYDIITDASKVKMTGFTSTDVLSGINATSSVTEAFKEVDKVITENEQTVSAALNDLEATKVENINVNGVEGTFSNKVASVTIDGADIKLDGYASGSSSAAVVATDTVNQAIGKLENQVKAAVAGGLQEVEAGSGITVSAVADNKQTITAKLSSSTGLPSDIAENAIKFDSTDNGMYIEYIDAGTY